MKVDFDSLDEVRISNMNGGVGHVLVRMSYDGRRRIIQTRMPPGSSIGEHLQTTGDDTNFVVSGAGTAVCDGKEEPLRPGTCHICPKGSRHSIVNTGDDELVLWTVVIEEGHREKRRRHSGFLRRRLQTAFPAHVNQSLSHISIRLPSMGSCSMFLGM